jgi:hypothetical protein
MTRKKYDKRILDGPSGLVRTPYYYGSRAQVPSSLWPAPPKRQVLPEVQSSYSFFPLLCFPFPVPQLLWQHFFPLPFTGRHAKVASFDECEWLDTLLGSFEFTFPVRAARTQIRSRLIKNNVSQTWS